jgi:hypothetical protein
MIITILVIVLPILFLFRDKIGISDSWSNLNLEFFKGGDNEETSNPKISKKAAVAKVIDSYNGVKVYNNGKVSKVWGRNKTRDGYNLGLKYQCVEFVKRYYYERFNHKMIDSYGHAKDFYDDRLKDGMYNEKRGLKQYTNPSTTKPKKDALLIYGPTAYNKFGHVAIATKVSNSEVKTISQNLGQNNGTRRNYILKQLIDGRYKIEDPYIIGWLSY